MESVILVGHFVLDQFLNINFMEKVIVKIFKYKWSIYEDFVFIFLVKFSGYLFPASLWTGVVYLECREAERVL